MADDSDSSIDPEVLSPKGSKDMAGNSELMSFIKEIAEGVKQNSLAVQSLAEASEAKKTEQSKKGQRGFS